MAELLLKINSYKYIFFPLPHTTTTVFFGELLKLLVVPLLVRFNELQLPVKGAFNGINNAAPYMREQKFQTDFLLNEELQLQVFFLRQTLIFVSCSSFCFCSCS